MMILFIFFNFLILKEKDSVKTDYLRTCDFDKKSNLYNCDELLLDNYFIFQDSQNYIIHFYENFKDSIFFSNTFNDSVSISYVYEKNNEKNMLIKYYFIPMIKIYSFKENIKKIFQTIYLNTNFINNN